MDPDTAQKNFRSGGASEASRPEKPVWWAARTIVNQEPLTRGERLNHPMEYLGMQANLAPKIISP